MLQFGAYFDKNREKMLGVRQEIRKFGEAYNKQPKGF